MLWLENIFLRNFKARRAFYPYSHLIIAPTRFCNPLVKLSRMHSIDPPIGENMGLKWKSVQKKLANRIA